MSDSTSKVWFITGASRGFGRIWAEAALGRGDSVAATARDVSDLSDLAERYPDALLPLTLDVVDRRGTFEAVEAALARFGRLDVVVANAGYGLFGAIEETTENEARRQLDVNVLGVVWLLQAVAPVLRRTGGGRVLITSSFGGLISYPTAGLYGASKYAVEGLGDSFAQETSDAGVRVTLVEPAAYATDFGGASASQTSPMPEYDAARARTGEVFAAMPPGDPAHTAAAILEVVDADEPPLRLLLGAHVRPLVVAEYEERMRAWREQAPLTDAAQ